MTLVLMLAGSILTPAIANAGDHYDYIFDFESYGYICTEYIEKMGNALKVCYT